MVFLRNKAGFSEEILMILLEKTKDRWYTVLAGMLLPAETPTGGSHE